MVAATRAWVKELEIPPSELAKLKWEQAKTATASGVSTWREHPNAKARLVRRNVTPRVLMIIADRCANRPSR